MIQSIQNLFDTNVTKVMDAFPSIYTKDDVVSLLTALRNDTINEIIQNPISTITEDMFQDFSAGVERKLDNYLTSGQNDPIEYSSAEFTIDYNNHLILENVEFNSNAIVEELDDILLTEFQAMFGKLITSKED